MKIARRIFEELDTKRVKIVDVQWPLMSLSSAHGAL
jgi:hypothetical protein